MADNDDNYTPQNDCIVVVGTALADICLSVCVIRPGAYLGETPRTASAEIRVPFQTSDSHLLDL